MQLKDFCNNNEPILSAKMLKQYMEIAEKIREIDKCDEEIKILHQGIEYYLGGIEENKCSLLHFHRKQNQARFSVEKLIKKNREGLL